MSGRPGRSGGSNRIDPQVHILRGTFRPERHAKLLPGGPVWEPTAADLEGLGAAGRRFVAELLAVYELNRLDAALAVEGAVLQDRLAEVRAGRGTASAKERRALNRQELAWSRALTNIVLALRSRL